MDVNRVADLGPEMIHFEGTMKPGGFRDFFANSTVEVKMLCSRVGG